MTSCGAFQMDSLPRMLGFPFFGVLTIEVCELVVMKRIWSYYET